MSYESALKDTETFVPSKHRETQLGGSRQNVVRRLQGAHGMGSELALLLGHAHVATWANPSLAASERVTLYVHSDSAWGDTWSAPCAWMSPVRRVIDVRTALDSVTRLQARDRLMTLRLRARDKGLQVVPWREDTPEEAEAKGETNDAMRLLQTDSLYDRE